jgi:hypothetical protein
MSSGQKLSHFSGLLQPCLCRSQPYFYILRLLITVNIKSKHAVTNCFFIPGSMNLMIQISFISWMEALYKSIFKN